MKKEKTEEERAEKERKKSEKREKKEKKSSKREKLTNDDLERLEEVRRSLKIKVDMNDSHASVLNQPNHQGSKKNKEKEIPSGITADYRDTTDRSAVIGLRYSQHGGSGDGGLSPDTSDTASTWSKDGSIGRKPRGLLCQYLMWSFRES